MKNNFSIFLSIGALALFFSLIISCEKEISPRNKDSYLLDKSIPLDIPLAKKYYEQLKKEQGDKVASLNNTTLSDNRPNRKHVMFSKAYSSSTSKATFVEIPMFYNRKQGALMGGKKEFNNAKITNALSKSFDRLIIYKDKKTGAIDQRIVTYIPDSSYLVRQNNNISHNHIDKLDRDFTGTIVYKTWDGKALFAYRFINGKKIKTLIRNRTKSAKKRKSPGTLEQVCTTYFYLEYTENCYYSDPESDWMTCTLTIDYYTEWTECVDNDDYYDNLTGDDCVDYGIGCPEDPTPTPTPNPDPCYNATSYTKNGTRILTGCDIENDVDNACLKSVVQTVVNNNIEFDVNRTLNSIFGTNDDVNLYFHDEELQSGIDGEARKRYDYSTNGVRQLGIDINLNQKTLPNASKEYIVATILHESLHAYFRVQNQTASLDHDEMANKYINWFKDIMDDYFPNISSTDNNALAWEGLGETKAWEKKSSEEKNSIAAINGKHRALTSGTPPCP